MLHLKYVLSDLAKAIDEINDKMAAKDALISDLTKDLLEAKGRIEELSLYVIKAGLDAAAADTRLNILTKDYNHLRDLIKRYSEYAIGVSDEQMKKITELEKEKHGIDTDTLLKKFGYDFD